MKRIINNNKYKHKEIRKKEVNRDKDLMMALQTIISMIRKINLTK